MAAFPKFVWVFNANYDGTIIYNDPVFIACDFWIKIQIKQMLDKKKNKIFKKSKLRQNGWEY
jgi:hypothetical protein